MCRPRVQRFRGGNDGRRESRRVRLRRSCRRKGRAGALGAGKGRRDGNKFWCCERRRQNPQRRRRCAAGRRSSATAKVQRHCQLVLVKRSCRSQITLEKKGYLSDSCGQIGLVKIFLRARGGTSGDLHMGGASCLVPVLCVVEKDTLCLTLVDPMRRQVHIFWAWLVEGQVLGEWTWGRFRKCIW